MFDSLSEKITGAFAHIRGKNKISESNIQDTLKEVRSALLEADVNFKVVKEFIAAVESKAIGAKVIQGVNPGEQFVKIVHDELTELMGKTNRPLDISRSGVTPILVVGLNGAGKTTFCGKLAHLLHNKDKKQVLLVPADTFRPAAKDQLITVAKSIGIEVFDSNLSLPPKVIARQGLEAAKAQGKNIVIIDTAGRLHVDQQLMQELKEVYLELAQEKPEILMVADAMTGQEAVNVVQTFLSTLPITGIVLSKMDSDARGGAALSISHVTKLPICFFSTGEKMADLELFHPERLASRILDMGDVLTLVEKAQEVIDEKEAERMMNKMEKRGLTLNDFVKQLDQISKLGSMESLLKMIPGMGGVMRQIGDLTPAHAEMKKVRAMIGSMTLDERDNHRLLNEGRYRRIAKGSGTQVSDVKGLIQRFEQMQNMMAGMMGMMKGGGPQMPTPKGFRPPPAPAGMPKGDKKNKGKGPWGGGFFR